MVDAAQFRALAGVRADLVRGQLEGIGFPGNDVHLEQEGRNPEGMNDIRRIQPEADLLVDRQVQGRWLTGEPSP